MSIKRKTAMSAFLMIILLSAALSFMLNIEVRAESTVDITLTGTEDYSSAQEVVVLLNELRTASGLSQVTLDQELTEQAMQRAAEIALYYNSSHLRPDGSGCATILSSSRNATAYAENIAVGQLDAASVMKSWTNSEGHYKNMMNAAYTSVGVGCFIVSNGNLPETYTIYWVQIFDNAKATKLSRTGTVSAAHTVTTLLMNLSFASNTDTIIACGDSTDTVTLKVKNLNQGFNANTVLDASNFNFTSSNPSVATVDTDGTVTILSSGTTTITAALKGYSSYTSTFTVTKNAHTYIETERVEATGTEDGYISYKCAFCRDTYTQTLTATGMSNTLYTFTTTDGDSVVNDASEYDAMILVFGSADDESIITLLQEIADSDWADKSDVKVIFVDTVQNEQTEVASLSELCGDAVACCWDSGTTAYSVMQEYIKKITSEASDFDSAVVLIDDSNVIQNVLTDIDVSSDTLLEMIGSFAEIDDVVSEKEFIYGDVDINNSINVSDALAVLKYYVKLQNLSSVQKMAADVDGSGDVDVDDALIILQYYVKLIDSFPAQYLQ